jgi:UV DNA damage endonuclease
VIENDDKQYNISDVLEIGLSQGIPVVFDSLHHEVNSESKYSEVEWINMCANTWKQTDGRQKLHYSQQDSGKRPGSHSATIDVSDFLQFFESIKDLDVDIMAEVKDKNLSAIKCINTISKPEIKNLEIEWSRYKYSVLEHSPNNYNKIRQILKDKTEYPVIEFYKLIDEAMKTPVKPKNAVNAGQHIWGYFKDLCNDDTRKKFDKTLQKVSTGESTIPMKRLLLKMAEEQQQKYLLESLYFMDVIN